MKSFTLICNAITALVWFGGSYFWFKVDSTMGTVSVTMGFLYASLVVARIMVD